MSITSIISERMSLIQPSATAAVSAEVRRLKAQGKKIIPLGTGEADLREPGYVDEGAIEAINNGYVRYPPVEGYLELREAIVNKFKRDNSLEYSSDQIIVCNGVKQALYNIFMATLNLGDEVIVPCPYWVSYVDMVRISGGNPVIVKCLAENKFKLSPSDLRNAISDKTKWVIFNSPSNPAGVCYTYDEIKALTDVLLEFPHVNLVSDDIYEHLVYDGIKFYTPAQVEPKLYERTMVVNGLSKAFSMTGWRVGYVAGDKGLVKAMSKLQSQSTSGVCSIAQYAAISALNGDQAVLSARMNVLRNRRDIALDEINNSVYLQVEIPQGALYLFISCKDLIGKKTLKGMVIKDDKDFVNYLLCEYQVAVIPGEAFGFKDYFRLSYSTNERNVRTGCERIVEACNALL